jgi:D-arabinose 1-dehydrogenase-like Zn-dependent alcohol dehydrogenase
MTSDSRTKRVTPSTMRIAQMTAFRKPLLVTETAIPSPAPDGVIVRVEAVGVLNG